MNDEARKPLTIAAARELSAQFRAAGNATMADTIDNVIATAEGARAETVPIRVDISLKLEKFDGEYQPGMKPVEVIETHDRG